MSNDAWDTDLQLVNERDEIIPNLWLGGWPSHDSLGEFKYVYSMAAYPNYRVSKNGTIVTWSPFDDVDVLPPEEFLHEIADRVLESVKNGKTLVHCAAGINRSALIVALVLTKIGWSPVDAINHLRQVRSPAVLMNNTFASWLLRA